MRRLDLLLLVLLLAGVGYGVFELGHLVQEESHDAALIGSGGVQSTPGAAESAPANDDDRRELVFLGGVAVLGGIALLLTLSLFDVVRRSRRRERWRVRR